MSCCLVAGLTGCGAGPTAPLDPVMTPLGRISGTVHGGQQFIGGSHVYVLAVGTGGYGAASSSLLLPGPGTAADTSGRYYVTSDQYGNFTVTGEYMCTATTQVYLYISGGDAGSGSNSAIGLMAALGQCPLSGTLALQVPFVIVNEVSTVVAAYALAGFATDAPHISSSNTALAATGVSNAMATALNMINVSTAQVPGTSVTGNALVPVQNIYTLADMLASCINSPGSSSGNCQTLLTNTGNATDTAGAAIAMAHAPFSNVSTLFGLVSASSPFQPALTAAPADLTLSLQYQTPLYQQNLTASDQTFAYVLSLAVDSEGNVWSLASNDDATQPDTTATFVKYSPTGTALATTVVPTAGSRGTAYEPNFDVIAVDSSDNLWAGFGAGELELSSTGALLSPQTGYACSGLAGATYTAFGSANQVYVGENEGSAIYVLSPGGACQGTLTNTSSTAVTFFGALTVDPQGNLFSSGGSSVGTASGVYEFGGGGNVSSTFPAEADRVAADAEGNIWTYIIGSNGTYPAIQFGEILAKYTASGTLLSPAYGYSGGGITPLTPGAKFELVSGPPPTFDGADAVWMTSQSNEGTPYNSIVPIIALKNDGTAFTPAAGLISPFYDGYLYTVVPDGSGNLWANPSDGSLVEFIGLTTPVATPILPSHIGQRP